MCVCVCMCVRVCAYFKHFCFVSVLGSFVVVLVCCAVLLIGGESGDLGRQFL